MDKQQFHFNLKELKSFCEKIAEHISSPLLITLEGELGAGKTQFTQFLVSALTQKQVAHSPTYSLINEYEGAAFPIYHVDLYRLKNAQDLESSGFWDLFEQEALILVEWANLLDENFIPSHWPRWKIEIQHTENPNLRRYTVSFCTAGNQNNFT